MIIALLHFIKGYIRVKFDGVSSEKILSIMANRKIPVWNLKYRTGTITANIYARDFKKLREVRRNTGVKVKIIRKTGLPFILAKHSKRSGFLVGAVIFFIILKVLSLYIWVINVEGNKSVKSAQILNTLNEIGVAERIRSSKIDAKNSAQNLLLKSDKLAWASLNIEGSVLNVNVSEIKEKISEHNYPTNLVALKDGIIKKIDAVSGNVTVTVGQNVHKGDVLVSGIVDSMTSTVFVRSNAEILAQVEKVYSKTLAFSQDSTYYTGKKSNYNVFEFFGLQIPLYISKNEQKAQIVYKTNQFTLFENNIPVRIFTKTYNYYKIQKQNFSEFELREKLSLQLKKYLDKLNNEGYIPISTEYQVDNSGVTVVHKYLCDENIAVENKILISQ